MPVTTEEKPGRNVPVMLDVLVPFTSSNPSLAVRDDKKVTEVAEPIVKASAPIPEMMFAALKKVDAPVKAASVSMLIVLPPAPVLSVNLSSAIMSSILTVAAPAPNVAEIALVEMRPLRVRVSAAEPTPEVFTVSPAIISPLPATLTLDAPAPSVVETPPEIEPDVE